jgi:hypothetical protein
MNIEYKVVFLKKINTQLIAVKTLKFKIAPPSIKIGDKTYLIDWKNASYLKTEQPLFKKHTYFVYYFDMDSIKQYNFNEGCTGVDPTIVDLFASQMVVKQIAKGIGGKEKTNWAFLIGMLAFGAIASALGCVISYTQKIAELTANIIPINPIIPI